MLIRIELPRDRDFCGYLHVLDEAGTIAFGLEWCAGRANDAAALRRGNDAAHVCCLMATRRSAIIGCAGSSRCARRAITR